MFNFKALIARYSRGEPVYYIPDGGSYDYSQGGIWVPDEGDPVQVEGAFIDTSPDLLRYGEGGTDTQGLRKFYAYTDLPKGATLERDDERYTVQEKTDHSDYDTDLRVYIVRRWADDV